MQRAVSVWAAVLAVLSAACAKVPDAQTLPQSTTPPPVAPAPREAPPAVPAPEPVLRWPAPGMPDTPVAEWDRERWWATAELLIGLTADPPGLEALDRAGIIRRTLQCGGGKVNDLVWEEGGPRAILFTTEQGCLFDPATGDVLGTTPPAEANPWLEGFAWRGDLIAIGEDIKPSAPTPMPAYLGTNWRVYRLRPGAAAELLYTALDGSRMAALSQDGRTLLSWYGNHGAGRPRLFRDGSLVTTYEPFLPVGAEFALDPRDDRFYLGSYLGRLQARSLEGQLRWEVEADEHARPVLWPGEDGALWIAFRHREGFTVVDEKGAFLWNDSGWPVETAGAYLVTRQEDGETHLLDRQGKVVAKHPTNSYLTRDRKAMLLHTGEQLLLYPLP